MEILKTRSKETDIGNLIYRDCNIYVLHNCVAGLNRLFPDLCPFESNCNLDKKTGAVISMFFE